MIEVKTTSRASWDRSRSPAAPKPPRPADYKLPVGSNARPPGKGWILVDYNWDERSGIGRLSYRRRWKPSERLVVEVQQPAHDHHEAWHVKPKIEHAAVLNRYFESQQMQMRMQALGVYGR